MSFLSNLPLRFFDLVEYGLFRTTLKLDLFVPPPCFWETWHEQGCDVKSRTPVENIIQFTCSLYPLLTRFSQILNGFCFINVENRSTLKMSSTSSDFVVVKKCVGSDFDVTDPLDLFPFATRPCDSMTVKFPSSSGHRKLSI